jgi:hypothetical protein
MQFTGQPMKSFALLVLLLAGFPVRACTVKEILQPQLLVEQAQGIYHVKAVGYVVPLQELPRGQGPKVRFTLLGVIKGLAPKGQLQFSGVLVQTDDRNDQTAPYDFVRPAGRHGMCFATEYRAGAEYLMLIKRGTPYWARLSPTNEQVFGPSDAWLRWVKQQATQSSKVRPNNSFKPKPLRGSA